MTLGIAHFVPNESDQCWLDFSPRIREESEARIDFPLQTHYSKLRPLARRNFVVLLGHFYFLHPLFLDS